MKKKWTLILAIITIPVFSCSKVTGELKFMNELRNSIGEQFQTEKIEINIKNNELVVSLTDPKFEDYSSARKKQISKEIGKLAREIQGKKESFEKGLVKFHNEEEYILARTSDTEIFQMYE